MNRPIAADKHPDQMSPWEREEVQLWLLYEWLRKHGHNPEAVLQGKWYDDNKFAGAKVIS